MAPALGPNELVYFALSPEEERIKSDYLPATDRNGKPPLPLELAVKLRKTTLRLKPIELDYQQAWSSIYSPGIKKASISWPL